MDTKKSLITIIAILAFALIATSIGQITGNATSTSVVTINPKSILPGDTITISVTPNQQINKEITIIKSPSGVRVDTLNLNCDGFKCAIGKTVSATYRMSASAQSGRYIIKVKDIYNKKEVGSGSFEVI